MPLGFVFLLMTAMMRGVGDTLTPLLALAFSTALGLLLTPLLIRGWFGLARARRDQPGRGLRRSATALTLVALGLYLRQQENPLAPDAAFLRTLRLDGALLRTDPAARDSDARSAWS